MSDVQKERAVSFRFDIMSAFVYAEGMFALGTSCTDAESHRLAETFLMGSISKSE
jgi:hypothetical protein